MVKQDIKNPQTNGQKAWRTLPNSASSDSLDKQHGGIDIAGKNGGAQTVVCCIGSLNDFIQGTEFENLLDWSKNLNKKRHQRSFGNIYITETPAIKDKSL